MSLLSEVAERSVWRMGPECSVARILRALDEDDRADLVTVLADERFIGKAIADALGQRGHRIGPETIRRHRRGDCLCRRS